MRSAQPATVTRETIATEAPAKPLHPPFSSFATVVVGTVVVGAVVVTGALVVVVGTVVVSV